MQILFTIKSPKTIKSTFITISFPHETMTNIKCCNSNYYYLQLFSNWGKQDVFKSV